MGRAAGECTEVEKPSVNAVATRKSTRVKYPNKQFSSTAQMGCKTVAAPAAARGPKGEVNGTKVGKPEPYVAVLLSGRH